MRYPETEIKTKDGRTAILRNARVEDSAFLIEYLKKTAAETPFLLRKPEEVTLTQEREEGFIKTILERERELMLVAFIDGKHVGNASLSAISPYRRHTHRCGIAIALYKAYWGLGLGRQMLSLLLEQAKKCGYEQAELEVSAGNKNAIALYESMGFTIYGTLKRAMKYQDGSYADDYLMVRDLTM